MHLPFRKHDINTDNQQTPKDGLSKTVFTKNMLGKDMKKTKTGNESIWSEAY